MSEKPPSSDPLPLSPAAAEVAAKVAEQMDARDADLKANPPPPRRTRGRVSKLTPELQEKIVTVLKTCGTIEDACRYADISSGTYCAWKIKGEARPASIYGEFLRAVEGAIVERRLRREKQIESAGIDKKDASGNIVRGDWRATAWMLERTEAKRYAPRVVMHVAEELNDAAQRLEEEFADEPHLLERALSAIIRGDPRGTKGLTDGGGEGPHNPGGETVQPAQPEPKAGDVPPA